MIKHKGYIGNIGFDPDAEILHGEVLGIRDVVTFEGRSVPEVLQAFRDSVDDYLEFCAERGQTPEKPCSGKFVVRIDPALHRQIAMVASTSNVSINTLVANCLSDAIASSSAPPVSGGKPVRAKRRKRRVRRRKVAR